MSNSYNTNINDFEEVSTNTGGIREMLIVELNNNMVLYPDSNKYITLRHFKEYSKIMKTNPETLNINSITSEKLLFFKSTGTSNPRYQGLYKGLWLPCLGVSQQYCKELRKKSKYITKMNTINELIYGSMMDHNYITYKRIIHSLESISRKNRKPLYLDQVVLPQANEYPAVSVQDIITDLFTYCNSWDMLKICVELNTNKIYEEIQTENNLLLQNYMEEFIDDINSLKLIHNSKPNTTNTDIFYDERQDKNDKLPNGVELEKINKDIKISKVSLLTNENDKEIIKLSTTILNKLKSVNKNIFTVDIKNRKCEDIPLPPQINNRSAAAEEYQRPLQTNNRAAAAEEVIPSPQLFLSEKKGKKTKNKRRSNTNTNSKLRRSARIRIRNNKNK